MNENIKKFLEKVSSDEQYLAKLKELNQKYPEVEENKAEIIKFADSLGIILTEDDFVEQKSELSEDELEAVSGGATGHYETSGGFSYKMSDCLCAFGGYGSADRLQKTCVCVLVGAGEITEDGEEEAKYHNYMTANGVAMWCAIAGYGGSNIIF